MDRLARRQVGFNTTSRDSWDVFAEHRRRVSEELILGAEAGRSRLCVLGAGNANDLDLPVLLAAHGEVHLVDLDGQALAMGASRQGVTEDPRLRLHGGVDASAALSVLSSWHPLADLREEDFEALASWPASRLARVLPGGFDRVASTCMITQLMETAIHALGPAHRQLERAERALRAGHLRLMGRLAAPDGEATLITEVVASDTLPGLAECSPEAIGELIPGLRRTGNHFRALHPQQLLDAIRAEPSIMPSAATPPVSTPWLWRLHGHTYLVVGMRFRPRQR
ncbi:hypothetical protein [Aquisphaera insulae]|uniref:hypothetical protein n=1 Tax=Aquisphaera insulae TaxID=2712864 RepID=UPI0013EC6A9B|nr:hypothetical protein [Aquisphaera insulae]